MNVWGALVIALLIGLGAGLISEIVNDELDNTAPPQMGATGTQLLERTSQLLARR